MQNPSFRNIHEGMKVFDSHNHEIGKVDWVQFGGDDPSTPQTEASSISDVERLHTNPIADAVVDAFRSDDLPGEVWDRLLLQGFVRIDADGIFAADRYVAPDQISTVSDDKLMLNVTKSDLVKRH